MEKLCLGCMHMKNNTPVCEHCGYDERSANLPHQLPVGSTLGNLGAWTDVYAICATFHYLLTGKVPADVHVRLEEG